MFVLGLQGSPRIRGNTSILLSAFLDEIERHGVRIKRLDVACLNISPCQEYSVCEKSGFCPIDDDMKQIYSMLRSADLIVMATPIFFYGVTAQMKALIDRSQALWARKYILGLDDPGRKWRLGFLLSLGATKGKRLFDGVNLTAKYFYDAVGAHFKGSLTYRQIEKSGEIKLHPTALNDAREKARSLILPVLKRKKILFICVGNTCRSQMASAFTQYYAGDRIEAESAGSRPATEINPLMVKVMEEKGIDMAFRKPKSVKDQIFYAKPDLIISMDRREAFAFPREIPVQEWSTPDPIGKPIETMRQIRDDIEKRIKKLICQ